MTEPRVADLTIQEFKELIREVVIETLETLAEVLEDPDEGLELREDILQRLERSLAEVESGAKTIPAEEVAKRLGLSW